MKIARVKIDKRGRLTLPRYFIEANSLNNRTHVIMKSINDDSDELLLKFVTLDEDEPRDNDTGKS